jgi:hypothetical protein
VNLGEALDQALTAKYPARTITSPPHTSRGFQARIRALEKAEGGEKGAAQAVGVTVRTWRGWKTGRKPSKRSLSALEAAHESVAARRARQAAQRAVKRSGDQVVVRASADFWWHGEEDYSRGQRTVTFDPIDISQVITHWIIDDKPGMADAFHAAVEDAYGYPVIFHGNDVQLDW